MNLKSMKILLHICCANCAIYPHLRIKEEGHEVVGFFYNPNIHPYQEFVKRLEALKQYSQQTGLQVLYRDDYPLEEFLRNVAHQPGQRCGYCYRTRIEETAREAKLNPFDAFSTTLLQSIHQNHQRIKETCEQVSQEIGVPFYYKDFRKGSKKGVEVSKAMGLYRQKYCGCIYSEKERFMKITRG